MQVGSTVVARGRAYEVVQMNPLGEVQCRCIITGVLHWFDVFIVRVVDPRESPEALLDAMSLISDAVQPTQVSVEPEDHVDGWPDLVVDVERRTA